MTSAPRLNEYPRLYICDRRLSFEFEKLQARLCLHRTTVLTRIQVLQQNLVHPLPLDT